MSVAAKMMEMAEEVDRLIAQHDEDQAEFDLLTPVVEAVRRLDDAVFGCTAPLSFTREGMDYLIAIHNALVAYDEATRQKEAR